MVASPVTLLPESETASATSTNPALERQHHRRAASCETSQIWAALDAVCDPEIPVLSLWELGVLVDVQLQQETLTVVLTPTYSGCPAMETMRDDVSQVLDALARQTLPPFSQYHIDIRLSPAWSSDWITTEGKRKLRQYGIAPPQSSRTASALISCPQCGSAHTQEVSAFGSTACKALYRCLSCLEPFDYFKSV